MPSSAPLFVSKLDQMENTDKPKMTREERLLLKTMKKREEAIKMIRYERLTFPVFKNVQD